VEKIAALIWLEWSDVS